MTSQSTLMVTAPLARNSIAGLRELLSTMNRAPGQADPNNSLVPFARLENLHFARFVILDDPSVDDIQNLYGVPGESTVYLALACDFDGPPAQFLTGLVNCAGPGLRQIFSFCSDFSAAGDLLQWMRDHDLPVVTNYANWRGRTMKQIREEARLRHAIDAYLNANARALDGQSPEQIHLQVRRFVDAETAAGRLKLSPPAPTPWPEKIGDVVHLIGIALLILLLSPAAIVLLLLIRLREDSEPVYAPRPTPEQAKALADIEDYEFTNQFSAMGSWKPGLVRRWMGRYVLLIINWTARHWIYTKGRLDRVRTIQFARWVYLDNRKRIFFATSYDGSLDSYNDDFINKVAIGLNISFSNGVGYPKSTWLVAGGARDEQPFKYFLRRHQLPTEVWYNAHPSTTAAQLERNGRIRQGLELTTLSGDAARQWVQLL